MFMHLYGKSSSLGSTGSSSSELSLFIIVLVRVRFVRKKSGEVRIYVFDKRDEVAILLSDNGTEWILRYKRCTVKVSCLNTSDFYLSTGDTRLALSLIDNIIY
jgi:hypothetical protein